MNKFRIIIFLLCAAVVSGTAWAGPVSENTALNIASQFMASRALPSTSLRMAHKAPLMKAPGTSQTAAYYAFTAPRGGFVIVAGDDRVPAVLGYSDDATFDPENMPEAMQELLEGYAAQIDALDHGAVAAPHLAGYSAIAPLVTAQWDQDEPYNILFPYLGRQHAYVGCVATAMAQVLHYWKWPMRTTAPIPTYTSDDYSIYMPELPVVSFDWDSMQDTYMMNDTASAGALAVSRLSLYCAQSVHMNFTPTGSGAASHRIPIALYSYFGYKRDARYLNRDVFSTQVWEDMLYQELEARRPVLYSGSKNLVSGHEFVCDGYDGNGRFHINWGWNGISNGYFLLSVLDPDAQGVGSTSGSYGYIEGQGMVIGVEPGEGGGQNELEVTATHVELRNYTETRSSSTYNFSISQITTFSNGMNQPISFDFGWGVYDSGNRLIQKLNTNFVNAMSPQYMVNVEQTLLFGSGKSSGIYRIVPIYSERSLNNWRPCVGADINYIKMVIQGNKCTVTAQGVDGIPSYQVNSIDVIGNMHPNRPINIKLNVTNTGNSRNDLIYMFANGRFLSEAFVDLEKGMTGDVEFQYMSRTTGSIDLTFLTDRWAGDTIGSKTIVIEPMPAADLSARIKVQNVTDEAHHIVVGDKLTVLALVTNNGTTTYNEDISIRLNKQIFSYYGMTVQSQYQTVSIAPNKTVRVQFDLDNVVDGWNYAALLTYYSENREKALGETETYTLYFTDPPVFVRGDVNGDGEVNIADVNAIIDIILGRVTGPDAIAPADVDGNGEINIGDVNAIIDIILNG